MRNRLFVILISVVFFYIVPRINSIVILSLANMAIMSFLCFSVIKIQRKVFSPFLLMAVSLCVFHCGCLWVSPFESSPMNYLLGEHRIANEIEVINAYKIITNLLIVFWCVGVTKIDSIGYKSDLTHISVNGVFRFFVFILYIFSFYFEFQRAASVSALGYGDGYRYGSSFGQLLCNGVNMLLLTILYASHQNYKLMLRYVFLIVIRNLFIIVFVGNRGLATINILIALFVISRYSYLSLDSQKLKRLYWVVGLVMVLILPLISLTRGGNITVQNAVSNLNPIESFLTEFGGTAGNVMMAIQFVDAKTPFLGLQILATALVIVPFSTTLFGELIIKYVSVASMFNDFYNRSGLGGSLLSQLIVNFGDTIVLYFAIGLISWIVSCISNSLMKKQNSIYITILLINLFVGLMLTVRGELYDTFAYLKVSIYLVAFIYIMNQTSFPLFRVYTNENI